MPKPKSNISTEDKTARRPRVKRSSPFKDVAILEKEITDFANKFKATVKIHSNRMSDYFEMFCFNYVVHFYELKGYAVTPENLQAGEYKYKCTTNGIQQNFSHFLAQIQDKNNLLSFEIHHNLAVQSSHDPDIFTTPDIAIINVGTAQTKLGYYDINRRFSFVENADMMSFCEAKQFNPFPELLFNFIGVVNELKRDILSKTEVKPSSIHIAPSLMISGKSNKQTDKIKGSLEARYCINIFYDLFYISAVSSSKLSTIRTVGQVVSSRKSPSMYTKEILSAHEDDTYF